MAPRIAKRPAAAIRRTSTSSAAGSSVRQGGSASLALTPADLRGLLPALHRHTRGKPFGTVALRSFLRSRKASAGAADDVVAVTAKSARAPSAGTHARRLPTAEEAASLLQAVARPRPGSAQPLGVWRARGIRYVDEDGDASVTNVRGCERKVLRSRAAGKGKASEASCFSWHECGTIYRLRPAELPAARNRGMFEVVAVPGFKRVGCKVTKTELVVSASSSSSPSSSSTAPNPAFRRSIVFDPYMGCLSAKMAPEWTFVYLHGFSNKGLDYASFPHYFCISGSPVRVVLPTAPYQEQTCFKDWNVWTGQRWRPIRFHSWFDYLTDRGGVRENDVCEKSLAAMRARLHGLIRDEVRRHGGDASKVIVGGASQGCCLALDLAMTYPERLGGVIGLVGHLLRATPLDQAKRDMPIHLWHEQGDKEMRWKWVEGTVQRLVDAGFDVTSRRELDPAGCGHWIQEIEGDWIKTALRQIVQERPQGTLVES
eukprot:TRINITY_DN6752_c0_g2_i1.p1 TRINITY_DN6752_c0_g2~~TRINITY_DN6752_c0_g2_i1.p1  ORF type:complete len:517 (-),score=85.95 TRINITY_DN6752_c0_g2_i1:81-1535(-)